MTQTARIFVPRIRSGLPLILCLALAMGGCKTMDGIGSFSARDSAALKGDDNSLRQHAESLGRRYDRNPADRETVLAYAGILRRLGQMEQAAAVLQKEAARKPDDLEILGAFGKALADAGRLTEAAAVLARAHTPERPNWSVLSAQGSVADRMGNHAAAQGYYEAALKIVPNESSILSNLGLSYALSKDIARAEETLRLAVAQPDADERVRQNYALVLALRGDFKKAESIGRKDAPPERVAANITSVRQSMAEPDRWSDLRRLDQKNATAGLQ